MPRKLDWDRQIGRRLRLRDLNVFLTVVQRGSMAKAAVHLGVTVSTVSEVITDLEHRIGVRLLDRSPKGVQPTACGDALLKRALVVFDELKQGIQDIEHLTDPASGEVRIACPLAIAFTLMPDLLQRFIEKYPRVVLHFDEVTASAARDFRELRERKYDLVLDRGLSQSDAAQDLNVQLLFNDQLVIAAGANSKWARRRRKIDLSELIDAPWIMQGHHTWNYRTLAEACRSRGLPIPTPGLVTLSMSVITRFLGDGEFICAMPRSVANLKSLHVLPVDLPAEPWPINTVTLQNRSLNPAAEAFIAFARDFTRPMRERQRVAQR
jgi:DNA-binding transcriptional LysR family regulator